MDLKILLKIFFNLEKSYLNGHHQWLFPKIYLIMQMVVSNKSTMPKYGFCFCDRRSEEDLKSIEKVFVINFDSHINASTVLEKK